MTESSTTKLLPCPHCGVMIAWHTSNRWRPFCSQRCKLIDLGQWASEAHRIPDGADENDAPFGPNSDTLT